MSDASQQSDQPKKRPRPRPSAALDALVIRELDMMRHGVKATLVSVAPVAIEIRTTAPLEPDEPIKVQVENTIQRFKKEVRGIIRRATPEPDGEVLFYVDLHTRLTPLEVSLLRMGLPKGMESEPPKWV